MGLSLTQSSPTFMLVMTIALLALPCPSAAFPVPAFLAPRMCSRSAVHWPRMVADDRADVSYVSSAASAFSPGVRAAPAVRAPLSFLSWLFVFDLVDVPQMALRPHTLVLGFIAPRKPLVVLVITLALAGIAYVVRKNKSEVTVRPAPAVDAAPPPMGSRMNKTAFAPYVWMEQTLQARLDNTSGGLGMRPSEGGKSARIHSRSSSC
jgi:hypothetical protein